jgi:tetratricopeptide (TPR) repeat protein
MIRIIKFIIFSFILIVFTNVASGKESFFEEALKMYDQKKYDDAKFLFERNIVFNPKNVDSYLYLAKIYNKKEEQKKEQQNLDTVLLIEPSNEEAILMSMKIALEKSNYSKVKKLSETFIKVCKNLCDENDKIKKSLKNIESKNES